MAASKTVLKACFLLLAVLVVASSCNVVRATESSDAKLSGRHLMQGGKDIFNGGPGEDAGAGGFGIDAKGNGNTGNAGAGPRGSFGGGPDPLSIPAKGDGSTDFAGEEGKSPKTLNCGFGEYVLKGKCTKCVSKEGSSTSSFVLRGRKCSRPFAVGSPTSCNFGLLNGLQIQRGARVGKVSTCIDSKPDTVTLYIPKSGFRFFGVTTKKYFFSSMSLAGFPLLPTAGIPLAHKFSTKVNGVDVDAIVFEGTSSSLKKAKGKSIAMNGVLVAQGGFNLCFAATVEVCS